MLPPHVEDDADVLGIEDIDEQIVEESEDRLVEEDVECIDWQLLLLW